MKSLFFLILTTTSLLVSCHSPQPTATKTVSTAESTSNTKLTAADFSLLNTRWRVNRPIFFEKDQSTYELKSVDQSQKHAFGHFVTFKEDGSFQGYYSAPCGNDCFTTIKGTYTLNNKTEINIFIESATQSGFCTNPVQFKNHKRGTFTISLQADNNFLLQQL
ncbi:hypothetical protein [Aureispira anguillae]|uniref:Lipocalin-like domain-containing protein n=1 Tax=Aureispira anguillae TaxID=2864201 RepID=A0A915YDG6_9BACT|nr:hypothetical protein [Aureispira anguillae]BDS11028.1 hypothetical protein AsAng_0017380 [Aureispira anguillae]